MIQLLQMQYFVWKKKLQERSGVENSCVNVCSHIFTLLLYVYGEYVCNSWIVRWCIQAGHSKAWILVLLDQSLRDWAIHFEALAQTANGPARWFLQMILVSMKQKRV